VRPECFLVLPRNLQGVLDRHTVAAHQLLRVLSHLKVQLQHLVPVRLVDGVVVIVLDLVLVKLVAEQPIHMLVSSGLGVVCQVRLAWDPQFDQLPTRAHELEGLPDPLGLSWRPALHLPCSAADVAVGGHRERRRWLDVVLAVEDFSARSSPDSTCSSLASMSAGAG
jgi:hypothetical protein